MKEPTDLLQTVFGCLLGRVRTTQRGCGEHERERDRGPSSVGSEPPLHDARTRGERGRSVTGMRVEDDVEALGAQNREVGRGGRDEVETRRRT